MDDGVKWQFQLVDGITASANLMASAIKSLEITLQHGDKSLASSHDEAKKHTEGAFGAMGEKVKNFAEGFFFVTESVKTAGEAIAETFEKIHEVAEYAFDVSDFRRNALIGLDAMVSTGYQASEVLEKLEGWAKQTSFAKDTFVNFGSQLLGRGFKENELKPVLAALSDVAAVNGGKADVAAELIPLLGKIRTRGTVDARELTELGALKINPDRVYEAYARANQTSLEHAKALFVGGGVKGTAAINAILGAVSQGVDKGGPLGLEGEHQALGSIPAQVQKAKDAFQGLFEHVDTTKFASGIRHITEQFEGEKGEKFAASISAAFGKLGDWVSRLDVSKVGDTVEHLAGSIGKAAGFVSDLFTGFTAGWADVAPAVSTMGEVIGAVFGGEGSASSDVKMFAEAIGNVVGVVVVLGEVVVFSVAAIGRGFLMLVEAVSWVVGSVVNVGIDIVEGLWTGIKSAWAGLLSDFHALVAMLPESVKHVLGIASPSRVFAGLGAQTMAGFTMGMESVPVREHMGALINARSLGGDIAPLRPNARSLSDVGRAGGGRGGGAQVNFQANLHFDGSKDPHATAEAVVGEMRRVFVPELGAALDQLDLESGG